MTQTNIDTTQAQQMAATMAPVVGVFLLVCFVLLIVPLWVAFKKAGRSPWLSLLVLIPGIGMLVALYVLAFMPWRVAPIAAEVAPYPPQTYPQPGYPPQVYTEPGAYNAPLGGYPTASRAPVDPPMVPPRDV